MKETQITFDVTIPEETTYEEIKEFISYHLEMTGSLSGKNPFINKELCELNPKGLSIYL